MIDRREMLIGAGGPDPVPAGEDLEATQDDVRSGRCRCCGTEIMGGSDKPGHDDLK